MKILKFSASWCAPCKVLETRMKDYKDLPVENVDIEGDMPKSIKYKIARLPTLVLVDDDGAEKARQTGTAMPPPEWAEEEE